MEIPIHLQKKLITLHGHKAEQWLLEFPKTLQDVTTTWQLTDIEIHPTLSYNFIAFASSDTHGDVVLKLGVPSNEQNTEIKLLNEYNGGGACRLIDYNIILGALLLKRIIPGKDLRSVKSLTERINITSDIINQTSLAQNALVKIPTYSTWLSNAFEKLRDKKDNNVKLLELFNKAGKLYYEIYSLNLHQFISQGDLHHCNILFDDSDKSWKSIDPQGVVCIKAFSPVVFMRNELEFSDRNDNKELLEEMTNQFSEKLNEPEELITKCFFINNVLSIAWEDEDGNEVSESVEELMEFSII
ncbi:hypothetical protein BH10BAC5_BH10BAC5_02620 [soil metagenome]